MARDGSILGCKLNKMLTCAGICWRAPCDRTAKAAAISIIGVYLHYKDTGALQLMTPPPYLKDAQSKINILRSRYHDKGTVLAESSRLRMELRKGERARRHRKRDRGAISWLITLSSEMTNGCRAWSGRTT